METLFANPETQQLWRYFAELSRIPRGSKAEAAAADWVAEQGRKLGCEVVRDEVGNILIRKKATPGKENHPGVAVQAHVDMVCEKNEDTQHDFLKDPIQLRCVGDRLFATGTTLGADNGVGLCAGLALLAHPTLSHGPLEVVVTVDEEMGMTGAFGLKPGWLQSKYLLNLDSEAEGELTIGCAGGVDTIATRPVTFTPAPAGKKAFRLKVSGLKGGHSGSEIHRGRGNAIRILAQVLHALGKPFAMDLGHLSGGNMRNAIPREAFAVFLLEPAQEAAFRQALAQQEALWQATFGAIDPDLTLTLDEAKADRILDPREAATLVNLLMALPNGVESASPDIAGLTQTSTNLGVLETHEDRIEITLLTRSSMQDSKQALVDRIQATCALAGYETVCCSDYPGWKPVPTSSLVQLVNQTHQNLFGKPMTIGAMHAGLECGLIGEKHPGMEMVSFGPDMWEVHTPNEHVSIPSVANTWKLLVAIVEAI